MSDGSPVPAAEVPPTDFDGLGPRAIRDYFGDAFPAVSAFADMLSREGELRGLIGPRELERLWERHLLNSAALVPFLAESDGAAQGTIVDVGSGAGLPGIVIACMMPHRDVVLIEPMERRVTWLNEVADAIGLENVRVLRGRAEEVNESVVAAVVTARAVAAVDKLVKWCLPLLGPEGEMVFLKGRSAGEEVAKAKYALKRAKLSAQVLAAPTLPDVEPTTVVRLRRTEPSE